MTRDAEGADWTERRLRCPYCGRFGTVDSWTEVRRGRRDRPRQVVHVALYTHSDSAHRIEYPEEIE